MRQSAAGAEVSDGYGDRGFQASGVIFPTGGYWEITGQVGAARLTLVNVVIKVQGDSSRSTRRSATEHITSPSTVASDLRQRGLARRLAADPW